jgi:Lon protease-like protein
VTEASVIALFPLHTVLFPGGPLPLRIFETRYTDMVRRCMREQQPFGVVLIQEGDEAGEVATTATVGCTARIADFHTLHDGLLGISCVGDRKFHVQRVWRASDGLNMGEVSWLPAERELALPERYGHLAATVRRALEDLAEHYEHVERKFADAAWIGARLTELLPIELADKQALLELDDPIERLDTLLTVVPSPDEGTAS